MLESLFITAICVGATVSLAMLVLGFVIGEDL